MPNWVIPLLIFLALAGFIGFAFRQGTGVKPDPDNPDNWPSSTGGSFHGDGSHHGS
jgi:hypothetical protein